MPLPFAVVLIAPANRRHAAAEAIVAAGGDLRAAIDWSACDTLAGHLAAGPVLAIEAEGVDETTLLAALPAIAGAVEQAGVQAVVTLDDMQIDIVAASLLTPSFQLLCRPPLRQQVAALAVAAQLAGPSRLSGRVREEDAERRHELDAAVAHVVALLGGLDDRDRGGGAGGVGDRHIRFGFEPPAGTVDPRTVRQAIRARRLRDSFLGRGLFEDPAWDMLLDLYAAPLEGPRVSVSSLCIAAAVAPTPALRWITRLVEAGLLERQPDPTDRRRAFITLSPRALAGMDGYAMALARAGLSFA